MSFDFNINKGEFMWILSFLTVLIGYSIINPYITAFIKENVPFNDFAVGIGIMPLGTYLFKFK